MNFLNKRFSIADIYSSNPSEETKSNIDAYFPNHFGALSEKGLSIRIWNARPQIRQTLLPNRSKVDVPFSLLTAQQLSPLRLRPSRQRHMRKLRLDIQRVERLSMFYAMGVADAIQCESKEADITFSEFSKLSEIWCDENLHEACQLHWRNKSYTKLWRMMNSAILREVKARQSSRVIYRLEQQVLASEAWNTHLKSWLYRILGVKEEQRFRKVIPKLRSRRTSRLSDSGVNEDTSADEAWDLLNRNRPVRRPTRYRDGRTWAEENRILEYQITKLLHGFQP